MAVASSINARPSVPQSLVSTMPCLVDEKTSLQPRHDRGTQTTANPSLFSALPSFQTLLEETFRDIQDCTPQTAALNSSADALRELGETPIFEKTFHYLPSPALTSFYDVVDSKYTRKDLFVRRHHFSDTDIDPFEAHADFALQLLESFFAVQKCHSLVLLPEQSFREWCIRGKAKTSVDMMLVYAVLCVGGTLSKVAELRTHSDYLIRSFERFNNREGDQNRLQVAQAHLLMTLVYLSRDDGAKYRKSHARAGQIIRQMKLQTEEGCEAHVSRYANENVFQLSRLQVIECRRRTFWLHFTATTLHSSWTQPSSPTPDVSRGTMLPNRDGAFQLGQESGNPRLDDLRPANLSKLGFTARLVYLVQLQQEVELLILSSTYDMAGVWSKETYNQIRERLFNKLDDCEAAFSESSTEQKASLKRKPLVPGMANVCCRVITMLLCRYGRPEFLSRDIRGGNLCRAWTCAHEVIDYFELEDTKEPLQAYNNTSDAAYVHDALCHPYIAFAAVLAGDIVSTTGNRSNLRGAQAAVGRAKAITERCVSVFKCASAEKDLIQSRLNELGACVATGDWNQFTWFMEKPLTASKFSSEVHLDYSFNVN